MLTGLSVHELAGRFRRKEATPTQAARAYLDRITALDPKVKAYMTVTADRALAQAAAAAAAVAADLAAATLGTDTGGSIRQPAAFCGRVGLKPTYGRVSRYGLVAFASSLDQVGPFGKDVRDAALVLQAIAGHDPMDSTSVDVGVPDYSAELEGGVKGLRIGIPAEYFIEGLDPEVEAAVRAAVESLRGLGAESQSVSLPHTEYGLAAYYVIAPAEASSNLARYDGVKYGLRMPGARDLIDM